MLKNFLPKNIVISNPEKLKNLIKAFKKGKAKNLHILSDFDSTLTKAFVEGEEVPALISVLRNGKYLTPDYAQKARALYAKFHPYEINPKIPVARKKKNMLKWWHTHFKLLIKSGLNRRDIKKVIQDGKVQFREGALGFFDILYKFNIPIIILSSSGLGNEPILDFLKKQKRFYNNVYIISNEYKWDKEGYAIDIKEPIITSVNKDETAIHKFPVYKIIKNRKNVILLGDTLEDIGMAKGFSYKNLIKIGFLNSDIKDNLEHYKRIYDIVLIDDASMEYSKIISQIREIFKDQK